MHIVIRSGKHDSSTAYTHGRDFDKLLTLAQFDTVTKKDPQVKPIVISFVGGPDENPCFPKTLGFAVDHFKYFFFVFVFKILCQIKFLFVWHLFKIIEAFTNDLLVKSKV